MRRLGQTAEVERLETDTDIIQRRQMGEWKVIETSERSKGRRRRSRTLDVCFWWVPNLLAQTRRVYFSYTFLVDRLRVDEMSLERMRNCRWNDYVGWCERRKEERTLNWEEEEFSTFILKWLRIARSDRFECLKIEKRKWALTEKDCRDGIVDIFIYRVNYRRR